MRTWRRLRPHCTPTPLPLHGSRWVGSRDGIGSDAQGSGWQGGDPSPPPLRAPRGCSRPGPPAAEDCPMDPPPSCVPSRLVSIDLAVLIHEASILIAMLCCKTVQPMSKPLAGMGPHAAYHLHIRCVCCMRLVSCVLMLTVIMIIVYMTASETQQVSVWTQAGGLTGRTKSCSTSGVAMEVCTLTLHILHHLVLSHHSGSAARHFSDNLLPACRLISDRQSASVAAQS